MDKKNLSGKKVLITGASRGIGRAIALRFAKNGADIFFTCYKNAHLADSLIAEIDNYGVKAGYIACDLNKKYSYKIIIDSAIKFLGSVDVLVNNAAIIQFKDFSRINEKDFNKMLDINIKSWFFLSQYLLSVFKANKNGGSIINMSSVGAQIGGIRAAHYALTKGAIITFTKSLAHLMAEFNVRVNAISPGIIRTDMTEEMISQLEDDVSSLIPLGRFGEPDNVAVLAEFLASDNSSYITGQIININGGMYI